MTKTATRTSASAQWARDFAAASAAIPAEWIWTDPTDGWQGIDPEFANHPLVRLHSSLLQVGYARGWAS